jgi:2-polyprenyl-3-methyl-5-hydroxy-6-metoxy-1,4-benzoquinol methylase
MKSRENCAMTAKRNVTKEKSGYEPHQLIWSDEKVDRLWGYYSGCEAYRKEYFSYQAGRIVLDQIERYVDLRKFSAVLDYGCGPGFLIEALLERMHEEQKCYGLDFSRQSVELVEEKFADHRIYGGTVWIENLPSHYRDESMDMVISLEVVEHLDDEKLKGMVREIYRLLRPRGYVAITTRNRENLDRNKTLCPECGAIFHRWQHVRAWTATTLRRYMETCGFQTVHIVESNFSSKYQRLVKYFLKLFPHKKNSLLYIGIK